MKLFKVFLIIFASIASVIIASRFFPHTYRVERNIEINKPLHETFEYMASYRNWEEWSLWNKDLDSTLYYFYNNKKGIGSKQYFGGSLIPRGYFETTGYREDSLLSFTLSLNRSDQTASGVLLFKAVSPDRTLLTWIDSGDVGNNPIKRFMIPYVTNNTEQTLDNSLASIKKNIESR